MSLSSTLDRNEKVEQYIRKKTRKPNALRFWIEGGVIPLYVGSCLIVRDLPKVSSPEFSQQVVLEPLVCGLDEYSLTLYRKSS